MKIKKKKSNKNGKITFFHDKKGGDGNWMFRAVSDQVYRNEEYHDIIKEKYIDYLLIERVFFQNL